MIKRCLFLLGFLSVLSLNAPAAAMSFLHDCSAALEDLQESMSDDNSCRTGADCTMVAQPPCGCENLAVNEDNGDIASEAMRICTSEGTVCEACYIDPDAKPPTIGCIDNHCRLIK